MRAFRPFTLLAVILVVATGSPAFAWGTKAHRVIGLLAEERLTDAARAAVDELLDGEDLATASTWADTMRGTGDKPEFWSDWAANWHYVNIAPGSTYAASTKNPRGDAYVALETFVAILVDEPVPAGPVRQGLESYFGDLAAHEREVKVFALKFLLHIVGDLQQPLHSGYESDRGGNAVDLTWFGERSNLHRVWDSQLVEQQKRSDAEMARRLANRITRTPASDVRFMESAAPLAWMTESQEMLGRIYAAHADNTRLGSDYAAVFVPTVDTQLVRGGLRTAYVLNSIFGGWAIGLWRDSPTAGGSLVRR